MPYWYRVTAPQLARAKPTPLRKPGAYKATTRGGSRLVSEYRYPERMVGLGVVTNLAGPERVYRVTLARPAANFGVVVTSEARGVHIEPRIVRAGDENRLVGNTSLPYNLNPYLRIFEQPIRAAGAILPAAGAYDVVFDTPSARASGAFTFRYWLNDTTPPRVVLRTRAVRGGADVVLAATDAGSGVDPQSLVVRVDGQEQRARFQRGRILVDTSDLRRGRRALYVQVSDVQESRNMEQVAAILPNTRIVRTTFVVR